jgi:hypothetical protein
MYDHFKYSEKLARQLVPISHTDTDCHFFRATERSELKELNEKISRAHGMIMIAIDGAISDFSLNNTDSLIERPGYSIVIVKQTKSTDTDTIFQAQEACKEVMIEVIARMLHDYSKYIDGCDKIDMSSLPMYGFGPIGDLFYGVILDFYLDEGVNYKLNPAMWK